MADVDKATVRTILRQYIDRRDKAQMSAQQAAQEIVRAVGLDFDAEDFDETRFKMLADGFARDVAEFKLLAEMSADLEDKLLD